MGEDSIDNMSPDAFRVGKHDVRLKLDYLIPGWNAIALMLPRRIHPIVLRFEIRTNDGRWTGNIARNSV